MYVHPIAINSGKLRFLFKVYPKSLSSFIILPICSGLCSTGKLILVAKDSKFAGTSSPTHVITWMYSYPVSLYNVPHLLFFPIPDRTESIDMPVNCLPLRRTARSSSNILYLALAADSSPLSPDNTNVRMPRKRC